MIKRTLIHLTSDGELNFAEYECVLAQTANQMINQPLGVKVQHKTEGDLMLITSNLLLMAKRAFSSLDPDPYKDELEKFVKSAKRMDELMSVVRSGALFSTSPH